MKVTGLRRFALATITVSILGFSCLSQEQETEIKIAESKVPAAVLAAFKSGYPAAKIRSYSKETEHGKVFYEIESVQGDVRRDVLYNPDGTVAAVEESIQVNDLPATAREAIQRTHPRATVTLAEKITRDGIVEFEAHLKRGRKRREMKFDANGNVIHSP